MVKTYLLLTKPGIIAGNLIVTIAGFLLASDGRIKSGLLLATILGLGMVIASACVFNNYIDRGIDKKMARTQKRVQAWRHISGPRALIFASLLGIGGALILAQFTNNIAFWVAMTGFLFYVVIYGFWKRRSVYGTIIGSISGAVPPVVGYSAASGRLDSTALLFFLILVLWQMPHFFAIAIYRFKDYEAAGLPVMPVKKGLLNTKINILIYTIGFIGAALALAIFSFVGYTYFAVVCLLGLYWLGLCITGFKAADERLWAKRMFRYSLVVITSLSLVLSMNSWLP